MNENTIVVMLIDSPDSFNNFKYSLSNYSYIDKYGVLCLTNNKELFPKIHEYLGQLVVDSNKVLVVYIDKFGLNYDDAKGYIKFPKKIILWDKSRIISSAGIKRLIETSSLHPSAGFVAGGIDIGACCVDLYGKNADSLKSNREVVNTDTIKGGTLITRYNQFMEYNFSMGNIEDYGINLRISGYQNYYDKEVK